MAGNFQKPEGGSLCANYYMLVIPKDSVYKFISLDHQRFPDMHTKEGRRSLGHAGGKRAVKESMEEETTGQKQLPVRDAFLE